MAETPAARRKKVTQRVFHRLLSLRNHLGLLFKPNEPHPKELAADFFFPHIIARDSGQFGAVVFNGLQNWRVAYGQEEETERDGNR